jgi:hypothetical protein
MINLSARQRAGNEYLNEIDKLRKDMNTEIQNIASGGDSNSVVALQQQCTDITYNVTDDTTTIANRLLIKANHSWDNQTTTRAQFILRNTSTATSGQYDTQIYSGSTYNTGLQTAIDTTTGASVIMNTRTGAVNDSKSIILCGMHKNEKRGLKIALDNSPSEYYGGLFAFYNHITIQPGNESTSMNVYNAITTINTKNLSQDTVITGIQTVNNMQATDISGIKTLNTAQDTRLTAIELKTRHQSSIWNATLFNYRVESEDCFAVNVPTYGNCSIIRNRLLIAGIETVNTTQTNDILTNKNNILINANNIANINSINTTQITSIETNTNDISNINILNITQNNRLSAIETINTNQSSDITAIEMSDTTQNNRLLAIEPISTLFRITSDILSIISSVRSFILNQNLSLSFNNIIDVATITATTVAGTTVNSNLVNTTYLKVNNKNVSTPGNVARCKLRCTTAGVWSIDYNNGFTTHSTGELVKSYGVGRISVVIDGLTGINSTDFSVTGSGTQISPGTRDHLMWMCPTSKASHLSSTGVQGYICYLTFVKVYQELDANIHDTGFFDLVVNF